MATAALCKLEVLFLAMPLLHQWMGTNLRPHTVFARRDAAWLACNMASAAEVVPALLAAPRLLQQVANVALDADLPMDVRTYALRALRNMASCDLQPVRPFIFHLFGPFGCLFLLSQC